MHVLLVDDHPLFLTGLRQILADCPYVTRVAEAIDLDGAIGILAAQPDTDCVFLDRHMPGADGLRFFERMAETGLSCPVAMLSADDSPLAIERALSAGAIAYIPKSSSPAELVEAVRIIGQRGYYLPERLERALEEHRAGYVRIGDSRVKLTRRQREVLTLLVAGQPNQAIARNLGLAESTVKAHVSTLFDLLGVDNRASCARAALGLGLVESTEER